MSSRLRSLDTSDVGEHNPLKMSPMKGARRFPLQKGRAEVDVLAVIAGEPPRGEASLFDKVTKTSVVVPTSYADTTKFHFSRVYPNLDQVESMFRSVTPIVLAPLSGENSAIIAYGQQGVGKTSLMTGSDICPGIIPRALTELFALRTHGGYSLSLSMLEVGPAGVRDLLPASSLRSAGVAEHHVSVTEFDKAEVNEVFMAERHLAFTLLHQALLNRKRRSRGQTSTQFSHFIAVLSVEDSEGARGTLFLADLAGITEPRLGDKETASSPRFRKTVSVNADLHQLERMVRCRAAGDSFMPHSALTRVLFDAFAPNSQVAVLVTVSPKEEDRKTTLHALNFGGNATPKALQGRLASQHITRRSPSDSVSDSSTSPDPETDSSVSAAPAAASILSPQHGPADDIPDIASQLQHAMEESKAARLRSLRQAPPEHERSHSHGSAAADRNPSKPPPVPTSRRSAYSELDKMSALSAKLATAKDEVRRLQSQVSVLQSKRGDHDHDLQSAREESEAFRKQVATLNKKNTTLHAKLREAREKALSAARLSSDLATKEEHLEGRAREISDLLHAAKSERDDLLQQLDKANARCKSLRSAVRRGESLQGKHDAEIRRVQQDFMGRMASLSEQRNVYKEQLKAANAEVARLLGAVEDRKSLEAAQDERYEDMKLRMKRMEDEVISERRVTRSEVERAAELDLQMEHFKQQVAELKAALKKERDRNNRIQGDLDAEARHAESLNKVVRALSDELDLAKRKALLSDATRSPAWSTDRSLPPTVSDDEFD